MFKSRKDLGGKLDPNINTAGRIAPVKQLTNREIREKELLHLLRKIKPNVADAISTAVTIMKNEKAADQNKLKAAVILLDNYKNLVGDLYDVGYDDEGGEESQQPAAPVFSLTMVK